jgi:uncharacterized membrane protein YdjX (TVP38/TMEM64 family)
VIAVIPGEPVEIAAGIIYGGWGGLFWCLLGVAIGEVMIFSLMRRFGAPLLTKIFPAQQWRKFRFLRRSRYVELFTFVLFLIPGTPKDVLAYFVALTPLSLTRFLLLSLSARIPSIVSSTFAGSWLIQGNYWAAIGLFAVAAAVGLIGLISHDQILKRLHG